MTFCHASRQSRLKVARSGASLPDLLIASSVAVLLMQVAAMGILAARDDARRSACANNLRVIGSGLSKYHRAHGCFPAAADWKKDHRSLPRDVEAGLTGVNWVTLILPQLGEQELLEKLHGDHVVSHNANSEYRTTELPLFKCPSDSYSNEENRYFRGYEPGKRAIPKTYARGNYAINGGSQARCKFPGHAGMPCASGYHKENLSEDTSRVWGNGVAGFNKSFSCDDFTAGLSKTVAVDEIRAGVHPLDPRGVWSVGQIGMSITWAHGIHGDAVGPNNPSVDSDDIHGCNAVGIYVGMDRLVAERMGCCDHCTGGNEQAGARSMHVGGVNALLCDGSVGFVIDEIDQSIWHVMHSRENPQDVRLPF